MKKNIPEAIGIIIFVSGAIVMAGWFFRVEAIKSILPIWVSMKFSTAICFFLSGIELYFLARFQKKDRGLAIIVVPIISMCLFLVMSSLLASTIIGVNVGVEEMFVRDSMMAVGSVTPGRPSIASMFNFILIALAGILTTLNVLRLNKVLPLIAVPVSVTGLTAILGYCIHQPLLYFAVPGKSSAMAVNTAVLFFLWGMGFVLTERRK